MTKPCDQLGPFLDGELPEAEAAAFRLHLAECPDCPVRLDSALQLAGLSPPLEPVKKKKEKQQVHVPFRPHWARRAVATAAVAVACALVVVAAPVPESAWYPGAPDRSIEARLMRVGARYHPYQGVGHGPENQKALDPLLHLLLKLRGDHLGIAEAYLARELPLLAEAELKDALPSDDVNAVLALAALQKAEYPRAVELTGAVLERVPGHLQAHWTRALALERLGLDLTAAQEFLEVAKLGEAGWSGEAKQRASVLQEPVLARAR
ncbi:MAG TPA: zf-HC2 domain-containing protein, partial [Myxococcaceae bacterium]